MLSRLCEMVFFLEQYRKFDEVFRPGQIYDFKDNKRKNKRKLVLG